MILGSQWWVVVDALFRRMRLWVAGALLSDLVVVGKGLGGDGDDNGCEEDVTGGIILQVLLMPTMAASAETLIFEQHKVVEDDWTIVLPRRKNQKRKLPKLKSAKQQQEEAHWTPTELETTPERELQLKQKMQVSIEKLEKSQFFSVFLEQIHASEASSHFCKVTGTEHRLKMVIYGIGSIESFESPRLQLSLAILMKRKLDWIGELEVFDPIISLTESKVLEDLGCRVLSVNEQGMRKVLDSILFFMPHCEAELYENLLKTNWRHESLDKIILFGNSFEKYEQHCSVFQDSTLNDSRKHLLAIRPFTREFGISTVSDDYFRAFQDHFTQKVYKEHYAICIQEWGIGAQFGFNRVIKIYISCMTPRNGRHSRSTLELHCIILARIGVVSTAEAAIKVYRRWLN
ncbi:hypothetical protein E3N88_25100 [Mikania micrantha]|uniref:SRR1-like domain-containing protein n=1 Tax=Mikania micrantha TaxID=192012 RepID=A0A5N6N4S0_9ASTR|nr:hypothetical protein E3N88_25100 [Mikania micrantha]